jgi:hypothetical protein
VRRPSGAEIEARLQIKRCIWCGVVAMVDWPYVCRDCLRDMSAEIAERKRIEAKETGK